MNALVSERDSWMQTTPLAFSDLDRLIPMHALIAPTGHIRHAGPTLQKLRPGKGFIGTRFLEAFETRRPRSPQSVTDLIDPSGMRLSLRLRDGSGVRLQGHALPLGDGGVLVNLSFGATLADAIRRFDLCASDFAVTDAAIDVLYLSEAKAALTKENRSFSHRLLGERNDAERRAFTDTLTGLSNRRALDMVLAQYRASGMPFALMNLDLDHFKEVNDTLGHAAGDKVLKVVAGILCNVTRSDDAIIRLGGDEFVLIFDDLTNVPAISRMSERIIAELEQPIEFEGQVCRISCSVGITLSDDYAEVDPKQMMLDADVALYAAKRAGRAGYRFVRDVGGVGQPAAALSRMD